jgi:RNA polymerase sigma factor (sigma-70 family)
VGQRISHGELGARHALALQDDGFVASSKSSAGDALVGLPSEIDALLSVDRAGTGVELDVDALPLGSHSEWSDVLLVKALSERSGEAYAELFRRHSKSVAWVVRMVLGRDNGCEDVVSEVFESLWLSPERFDPSRGSLLSYLRIRARGLSIDTVRTDARRQRREDAMEFDIHFEQYGVEHELIASDERREMREALALLPQSEADPLYLAYFKGMTYKAVAVRLGVPEGTVKSRIRHGLTRLRSSGILRTQFDDQRLR